ncbi:hypothetical protein PSYJYH_000075 [Bacillus phage PSYJ-YH]|nr:hypothetical protein PSYJYH_000075 [Bacillus phage PSYJ-YH]
MTRKIRYRQVLRYRTKGHGKRVYNSQFKLQQSFWKEDGVNTLDISKVRELHSELGTWDINTIWESWRDYYERGISNTIKITGKKVIHPKANYKSIKKAKEIRWKEQERRTEEFLASMGV